MQAAIPVPGPFSGDDRCNNDDTAAQAGDDGDDLNGDLRWG